MSRTYSRYSTPSGASTGSYGDTPSDQGYDRGYSYGSYGAGTAYGSGYGSTDYTSDRSHSYGSYSSYGSATDLADRPTREYTSTYGDTDRFTATDTDYAGGDADAAYDDYDDDEIYEYDDAIDRRWVWVAGVAGAILLVAVICTVVILGGGDSGPVTAPITPPGTSQSATPTASAVPSAAPRPRVTAAPPTASLAPETVTTVTPTAPAPTAEAVPPVDPAAVPAAPVPNTVTYRVAGNKSLLDLVTVIYTDGQGALQTDVNVALPWAKTVTLNPGVTLSSVTATSVTGQLNCSISDGSGAVVALQNNNTMIATCTK
ncbi:hypothetical protein OS122_16725 [Mycolicibacterium mucogenicum]|uniref:hypothetical protein n=1 Tax=Mycolicibacterium mucogenicum TaxID=56689 RepID=UPI00226A140D|nr:hypothetical protein [Mycolicibacterium mucogenicum]MCX8562534.1 hypothetical protein [Mycolicibacterium mucogenicum]